MVEDSGEGAEGLSELHFVEALVEALGDLGVRGAGFTLKKNG